MGRGAKGDAKNLIFIVVFQAKEFSPGFDVAVEPGFCVQFGDLFLPNKLKAVFQRHNYLF
jgi:hypothetical protein